MPWPCLHFPSCCCSLTRGGGDRVSRLISFTAITMGGLLPDTLRVLPTAGASRGTLRAFLALGGAFNALMLYWFVDAVRGALEKPEPA